MNDSLKVIVVGLGQMGTSHALACHNSPKYQIQALVNRSPKNLPLELERHPQVQFPRVCCGDDELDHDELCAREQRFFLEAVRGDWDLGVHMEYAVRSLGIVLAADLSMREKRAVRRELD